jgi:hypothetical protein
MPTPFKLIFPAQPVLWFAALYATGLVQPASAQNAQDLRWIHGSWINVRTTAAADAPVAAHLTTNTQVTLKTKSDKACEIAWGEGQRGFVACKLLGERRLTLAELANETLNGKANAQYAPARAFWVAPSMASLFAAGKHFQKTLLSPEQYTLETENTDSSKPAPRLVRYPVAEFEAMKAELAKGLVASADLNPPLLSCKQLQAVAEKLYKETKPTDPERTSREYYPNMQDFPFAADPPSSCPTSWLRGLRLPAITASVFKSSKEIAPGSAGVERIGAHFAITERGRVLGTPKWEFDYDNMRYTGAWDIGRYQLTLDKPVVEHVIGRTGLVGAYQWTPQATVTPYGPDRGCDSGLRNKRNGKQLLANYPNVKDELVWFQAPAALPFKTAKVTTRNVPVPEASTLPENGGVRKIIVYEIDLDRDGVADFLQWDIWSKPQISGPDPLISRRMVFVNINGEWYPFDQDSFGECT